MTKADWNAAVDAVSCENDRAWAEWSRAEYENASDREGLFAYAQRTLAARDAMREARDAAWGVFVAGRASTKREAA
ncbi:MAG: hypothetical protein EBT03_11695 [Betaproteobacteria bacterium]|nr:hypothetical protein [Betaproteobacteria bacterium]